MQVLRFVFCALLWGGSLGWIAPAVAQGAATSDGPRMAMGVIVKLKEPASGERKTLPSIIRLKVSDVSGQDRQVVRERIQALRWRRQVPYMSSKPTAFAAEVVHDGRPVPLAEAQAVARRLRADPEVEWAIPNEMLRPATVNGVAFAVSPTEYSEQPWIRPRADEPASLGYANFPGAWSRLAGRSLTPVIVAVLDSGILPLPDLAGRMLSGYDFVSESDYSRDGDGLDADPRDAGDWLSLTEKNNRPDLYPSPCEAGDSRWHGLAIANVLAATPGNSLLGGVGILSSLPGQVLLPVRVSGICGASTSDIIEGMLWSAGIDYQGAPARNLNPARVINISLGGDSDCASSSVSSPDWLYRQAVDRLRNKGVLVVASAGNGDANGVGNATLTRPASCPGVLAVTSVNKLGFKAAYANLANSRRDSNGNVIRLKAHALAVAGGDVVRTPGTSTSVLVDDGIATVTDAGATTPTGTYQSEVMVGTSFAAPMVSGVAALMLAVDPGLTVNALLTVLSEGSQGVLAAFPTTGGGSLPTCDPDVSRAQCYCTTNTCGGGLLDADAAIAWALGRTPSASSFNGADEFASEFVPTRAPASSIQRSGGGGGGGGALDGPALLALALAALVGVGGKVRRAVQRRQAVNPLP